MPQGGRMSPAIPLSVALGKDSNRSAESMPGRKQGCTPPSSLLLSSRSVAHAFLQTSEMQFCPILTSAAEGCLPVPHSCWSGLHSMARLSVPPQTILLKHFFLKQHTPQRALAFFVLAYALSLQMENRSHLHHCSN